MVVGCLIAVVDWCLVIGVSCAVDRDTLTPITPTSPVWSTYDNWSKVPFIPSDHDLCVGRCACPFGPAGLNAGSGVVLDCSCCGRIVRHSLSIPMLRVRLFNSSAHPAGPVLAHRLLVFILGGWVGVGLHADSGCRC